MSKIKTITISAKCSDLCSVQAYDADSNEIATGNGYVPDFMPAEHYGDYVMLDIDVATGKILNWTTPTDAAIKRDIKNMWTHRPLTGAINQTKELNQWKTDYWQSTWEKKHGTAVEAWRTIATNTRRINGVLMCGILNLTDGLNMLSLIATAGTPFGFLIWNKPEKD